MDKIYGVIFFSFGLLIVLFAGYFPWFKPDQYMGYIHKRRGRLKSQLPFLPDWLIGFTFFYEQRHLSIWWARICALIALIICILGILGSIYGPS